jgi:hypothetical protein
MCFENYVLHEWAEKLNIALVLVGAMLLGGIANTSTGDAYIVYWLSIIIVIVCSIILLLNKVKIVDTLECTVINKSHQVIKFYHSEKVIIPGETVKSNRLAYDYIGIGDEYSKGVIGRWTAGDSKWIHEGIIINFVRDGNKMTVTIVSDPHSYIEIVYSGKGTLGTIDIDKKISYVTNESKCTGQYSSIITPSGKHIPFITQREGVIDGLRWTCEKIAFNKSRLIVEDFENKYDKII